MINIEGIDRLIKNDQKNRFLFDEQKHLKKYYKHVSLKPFIINDKQLKNITVQSEGIYCLLEKTIKEYFLDKRIEEFFSFSKKQNQVIRKYCSGKKALYLTRFDSFIDEKDQIKFLEFNVNFPGGIDRLDDVSQQIYKYYKNNNVKLSNFNDIRRSFVKLIKKMSKQYKSPLVFVYGQKTEPQNIVSMHAIGKILKKNSVDYCIAHWKDLRVSDDKLYFKKRQVKLIFRTALLQRVWEYDYKYAKPVLDLLDQEKIFMINLPQSYIAGVKNLLALWFEDWFRNKLTKKEINLIDSCIPKTYMLSNKKLSIKMLSDKNNWVIKPIEGIGGKKVYVGKKIKEDKWNKIIQRYMGDSRWIAQEFIQTPRMLLWQLDTKDRKISKKLAYVNLSPWIIDGKMAGISARYSTDLVVNIAKGGGIISVLNR